MTAFYEWVAKDKKKVRHKIFLQGEEVFFVPALYVGADGKLFSSLVTVPSNQFMENVHNRMPAILKPKDVGGFLDSSLDEALKLCTPYEGEMDIVQSNV